MASSGTTGPVPGPPNNFSLTNFVELILINSQYPQNVNKFEIIKFDRISLKTAMLRLFNVSINDYNPYIATFSNDSVDLLVCNYEDYIQRFKTYFIINKDILYIDTNKIYELYFTNQGNMKVPVQMPSRIMYDY